MAKNTNYHRADVTLLQSEVTRLQEENAALAAQVEELQLSLELCKRSTTTRIQSKPGRPCNPTGFVYSQSGVSRYFFCFTSGFQGIRRSRIWWDGVLP